MPLSTEAAARKDKLGARHPATLQHCHFAVIAGILAEMNNDSSEMAESAATLYRFDTADDRARGKEMVQVALMRSISRWADALAVTNPKFNRARFLAACNVLED